MDFLKKFFFLSFKFNKEVKKFVIGLVIYVAASFVITPVCTILGLFTLGLTGIIAGLCNLYILAGIVISILVFTKVIKVEETAEAVEAPAAETEVPVAETEVPVAEVEEAPAAETTDAE